MKKRKISGIILHLLNILKYETDAQHLITQKELVKRLRAKGISCNKYSVERNLDCLKGLGYKIYTIKGSGTYLKTDNLSANDVFVLLEGLKRSNFAIEPEYILKIEEKLKANLNKFELQELKNKNMLL